MCLHPLFTAVVRACAQSQLVLISASMCHRECCRLTSIKAASRRSCAGAASEFSTPLPSVIGHTQRRTKRTEAGTDWREERVGSEGQKMEKTKIKSSQIKKKRADSYAELKQLKIRLFKITFYLAVFWSINTT